MDYLGFMFGLIAFTMAADATSKLKKLRQEVEELKKRISRIQVP